MTAKRCMPLAATSSVSRATVSATDRPLILVTVSTSSLVGVSGIARLRIFESAKNDEDGKRDSQDGIRPLSTACQRRNDLPTPRLTAKAANPVRNHARYARSLASHLR